MTSSFPYPRLNRKQFVLLLVLIAGTDALYATDSADSDLAPIASQPSASGLFLRKLETFGTLTNSPSAGDGSGGGAVIGTSVGGAAEIGVSAVTGRARYSVAYTALYSRLQQSGAGTIDHSLYLSGVYDVSSRSCVTVGLNTTLLDISNSLLASPAQFQLQPCFTNPLTPVTDQFALSSSTALSGASALLFGERVLNVDIGAAIEHRRTSRLTFSAVLHSSRTQTAFPGAGQSISELPLVSAAEGNFQSSYRLSDVTQLGFSVSDLEILSRAERGHLNSVAGSFARQLRRGIHADFRAGVQYATVHNDSTSPSSAPGVQAAIGAGLNYNRIHHVFRFSVERRALDPYGISAARSVTTTGRWSYQPGGGHTTLSVAADRQDLSGGALGPLRLIELTASLARVINAETDAQFGYAFTSIRSAPGDRLTTGNIHVLRFTVAWHPTKFRIL